MIKVAIVEDDIKQSRLLAGFIERYGKEHKLDFSITDFDKANDFYKAADKDFDIVFLDIELPDGNGMEIAEKLRENDKKAIIIFVTNLAQYAVKGYKVRAFDFIVKPITYYNFVLNFPNALECLETNREVELWVKQNDGKRRLLASQILYVEVMAHYLTYHTKDGLITALGSIAGIADELSGASFSFCNRCYLVNLKYVTQVTQTQVLVGNEWLQISRRKHADFLKDLNDYLAGGN